MVQNLIALIITFAISLIFLRVNDFAAHRGWISSRFSRKIIHIGTGPLFVLCWLLYNNEAYVRYLAALVPLTFTIQFFLIGIGKINDEASVKAMSRTGDRREILKGPLYYGIIFVILTIVFWKDSPTGIVALMLMCGGDGLADILGRSYGKTKIPWNRNKSWIGSFGMFFGGWILTIFIMTIYTQALVFTPPFINYLFEITLIALVGMIVETLPLHDIDNITVTLSAVVSGYLLF